MAACEMTFYIVSYELCACASVWVVNFDIACNDLYACVVQLYKQLAILSRMLTLLTGNACHNVRHT